jgi:hypothetical protein
MRALFITLMVAMWMTVCPNRALACSCFGPIPSCKAFVKADVVLDARVMSIEPVSPDPSADKLVKFEVGKTWKGVSAGPIEVITAGQNGGCGYHFNVRERYLVFAQRRASDGRLEVSSCSNTRPFSGSGEDAEVLDAFAQSVTGGLVFGSVKFVERSLNPTRQSPFDTRVRLIGGGREMTARSVGGRFDFRNLPHGRYELDVTVPEGYATSADRQIIEINDWRPCLQHNVVLQPIGRISGQLVGPDGQRLANFGVDLADADAAGVYRGGSLTLSARTRADGSFEFPHLAPGRYVVGVNLSDSISQDVPYSRLIYTGDGAEPQVIALGLGATVRLAQWQLPPPPAKIIASGFVWWQDGAPAMVPVTVWDVTSSIYVGRRLYATTNSDAHGRFTASLREGHSYVFRVDAGPKPTASPAVEAAREMGAVQVVIPCRPAGLKSGVFAPYGRCGT